MQFRSIANLNETIKESLPRLQPLNCDLVVGLPRSGVVPASLIALYLNVHYADFPSFLTNAKLKHGYCRSIKNAIAYPWDARRILLVDDSIHSGKSLKADMKLIPENLHSKIITLAVYAAYSSRKTVDMYLEFVPSPRFFEWNLFNHTILKKACVDIDGVLCIDPTNEENDDSTNYRNFILHAKPLFLTSTLIHSLVTSRLEKYRKETETWLQTHHIQYRNLIMLDLPNQQERIRTQRYGQHKAEYYRSSDTALFIESNPSQAKEIYQLCRKPVYCVKTNELFDPVTFSTFKPSAENLFSIFEGTRLERLPSIVGRLANAKNYLKKKLL